MDAFEHKDAGDQIRIEKLNNPYFKGSEGLSPDSGNKLRLWLMQTVDDVPVPLDLELSAGEVVALAGDYYNKSGWGMQLQIPEGNGDCEEGNEKLLSLEVDEKEARAFQEAYHDLASPSVTKKAIDHIYAFQQVPSLLRQIAYTFTVKDYGDKLKNNLEHFSPWSLLIHGARAVVNQVKDKVDKTSLWIKGLLEKNGFNKTVVALANKNARIAWSVITKGTNYSAEHAHG